MSPSSSVGSCAPLENSISHTATYQKSSRSFRKSSHHSFWLSLVYTDRIFFFLARTHSSSFHKGWLLWLPDNQDSENKAHIFECVSEGRFSHSCLPWAQTSGK